MNSISEQDNADISNRDPKRHVVSQWLPEVQFNVVIGVSSSMLDS